MEKRIEGRTFREFSIGNTFHSSERKIAESDLLAFAELTGDKNRIHVDPVFAAESIYGKRIAHGLLGLSIIGGLAVETGFAKDTAVALRNVEWKFRGAVFIGDIIRAEFKVVDKRDLAGQDYGLIKFQVTAFNQNDEKVQTGAWTLLILK
jgi:acyl dehydratase